MLNNLWNILKDYMKQPKIILANHIGNNLTTKRILRIMAYKRTKKKEKKEDALVTEDYQIVNIEEMTGLEKTHFENITVWGSKMATRVQKQTA
jgi:hypothetical protein